jgi:hypothetical protein
MRMPSALVAARAGVIALGLPLLCVAGDIQKPAILWERALDGDVYGSALAGDTIVLLTLDARAPHWMVEGHDAKGGALRWRRAAPGTSLGPGVGGSIILGGRDGIRALDAASGAERWHFPRPVVETNAHDGALGGFSSPALLDGECLYAHRVRWSIDFNSVRAPAALGPGAAFLPGHGLRAVSWQDRLILAFQRRLVAVG